MHSIAMQQRLKAVGAGVRLKRSAAVWLALYTACDDLGNMTRSACCLLRVWQLVELLAWASCSVCSFVSITAHLLASTISTVWL